MFIPWIMFYRAHTDQHEQAWEVRPCFIKPEETDLRRYKAAVVFSRQSDDEVVLIMKLS